MKHHCPICNESVFKPIVNVKKADITLSYIQCLNCKFVYNYPPPSVKWLKWFYSDQNPSARKFESDQSKTTQESYSLWKRRLNGILRYKKEGKFLDIGCGKGILLSLAQKRGFKVYGTEYSLGEINYCRKEFGLKNIYHGDISQIKDNKFDTIVMFHVLEHIIDFRQYLVEIKKLLNLDGLLVIEVPNKDWLKGKSYLEKLMPHQIHHNHFSANNLKVLLENTGFERLNISFDNPFHVPFLNKWTVISLANKILFKFGYYNLSPVIKIYLKKK